jgi:putative membrane protein
MSVAATVLAALVAVEHLWFLVLEMFLWTTPFGRRTFRTTPEFAAQSKALAMNQGLYNGFLAAGIAWALATGNAPAVDFFLGCVIVAGIFGGLTVSRAIIVLQAVPAAIALAVHRLA